MLFHKKRKLLFCTCFLLFIASIFFSGIPVLAHRLNILAYVENNTIFTESYFHDGKSVINGKIEVYDSTNVLIHTGYTDRNGKHSFKVPKVDDLTIVLDTTGGHRAMYVLKAEQIKPPLKNIAQLQKETGFSVKDIFAGIGYILGLMGLVLYFKSKGRK